MMEKLDKPTAENIPLTASNVPFNYGLICLTVICGILGIPSEYEQLKREFNSNDDLVNTIIILRAARKLGLKAKHTKLEKLDLGGTPLPLIAIMHNGSYIVVGRAEEEKLSVFDPRQNKSTVVEKERFYSSWTGEVILFTKRLSLSTIDTYFNIHWFIPVIARFKRLFGEVIGMAFILQLVGLATPLFSQVIIDKVLVHKGISTLDILAIGLLVIGIFELLMSILKQHLFSHTTNRVDVILGTRLFQHLSALPMRYFEARRVGDIANRMRELDVIRQFITGPALNVVLDVFFGAVFIIVMFFYSITLSFVVLGTLPFFIILSLLVMPIYKQRLNYQFMCASESQSFLVEYITGVNTVKSLAVEPQMNHKWEGLLSKYVKATFSTISLSNVAGNTAQFIQKMSTLAILWFGAHQVMEGDLTVGQLIAFQMLSSRVIDPILRLVNAWQGFHQTKLSIDRLGDILNYPVEPSSSSQATQNNSLKGQITLQNVVFRYRSDGPPILDNISLNIGAGRTIGIVGRSGSGKSTFTKLIQRLYTPERGRIFVDGMDISQINPSWLRQQVGVVLQENFLFNGSVRENIAIAMPGATMDRVVWASNLAGAHDFILELPEGYDTPVGERGTALSGGQRQRIAIARALITNPRILIFDEATSALDYQSERIIQDNLKQICIGRTVLIIAHRLSTVRDADIIIVMEKGQIAEAGTHNQLIKKQGAYFDLHQQQEERGNSKVG